MLHGLKSGRRGLAIGLVMGLGLGLAACSGTAPSPSPEAAAIELGQTPSEARFKACADRGGELRREGRVGAWRCVTLYADAGKPCRDRSDCLGRCQAVPDDAPEAGGKQTGVCAATDSQFGCQAEIVNGRSTPVRCID